DPALGLNAGVRIRLVSVGLAWAPKVLTAKCPRAQEATVEATRPLVLNGVKPVLAALATSAMASVATRA
ncbi:hypothetical protein GP486_008484, partial [Trichoglossum hirsutum]